MNLGDQTSIGELLALIIATLAGGVGIWKTLPILFARLAAALGSAKAEAGIIDMLNTQVENANKRADAAETWAKNVVQERNELLGKVGELMARVTTMQQQLTEQTGIVEQLRAELTTLRKSVDAKSN
ncbi:hypothetical protein [Bradyrhizobium sp.]|uniref:hypothetical protein n=1 Tax=Bradyrhizobium sp. TaxID=376 RepID=UPI0039E339E5